MATGTHAIVETPVSAQRFAWGLSSEQPSIRVLAVDEHLLVVEGLASVIHRERGMEVVAGAVTGAEAIAAFREHRPDVMTIGLMLPDMPGEEVVSRIVKEFPPARIVGLISGRGDAQILRALAAGVRGLVLKGMPHRELIATIRTVHAGKKAIPNEVASMLAEHLGEETLTPREIQVLGLVAHGNRNKQVAAQLSIADETVRMHMKNILGKLGANDRTHAVTIALARGMLSL